MSMFPRRTRVLYCLVLFLGCVAPTLAQLAPERYTLLLDDPPVSARFARREQMQSAAGVAYRTQIEARQRQVRSALTARNISVTGSVSTVLNAIFVAAPASRVPEMLAIPGVAAVRPMRQIKLLLNKATQLMNAPAAWTAVGGQSNAGKGMKIAIIDTGIDQTHPAFQDSSLTVPAGFPICTTGHPEDCTNFTNSKVIVARSYVRQMAGFTAKSGGGPDDTSVAPSPATSQPDDYSPRDHVGHGTATASAAAGNTNTGTAIASGGGNVSFSGMAPKAFLGNYKIFGSPGVNDSPTDGIMIQAIEDALNDGMDVASVSVGSQALTGALDTGASCGLPAGQPCDPLASAFENAVKAGLVIVAAAGNSGSDAVYYYGEAYPYFNSISSPSSAPSVISVGATTNSHAITPTVSVSAAGAPANVQHLAGLAGDSLPFPSYLGANVAPLVDVAQLGNDGYACSPLPAYSLYGAYALIERGPSTGACYFSDKALNAQAAGAIGIVFYMADSSALFGPNGLGSDGANFTGPTVMISNASGVALKSYIDANPRAPVTIDLAGAETDLPTLNSLLGINLASNQLASYSSFGPAPDGSIKPDLVATAGLDSFITFDIYGMYLAAQNYDLNGELYSASRYVAADGTSFATPLVAGAAAMVKQMHPTFTPTQIKSAVVNSAAQDTTTDDGFVDVNGIQQSPQPVNVQWLGAGRLDAGAALNSSITVEPATVSFGYLRTGATLPINQNLTITNKGAGSVTVALAVAPNKSATNATVTVAPATLTLAAGASSPVTVSLTGAVPAAGSYSGAVTLSVSNAVTQRVPYLFLVPDGVPFNIVPLPSSIQGVPGQDAGSLGIQVLDQFGVPVAGASLAFSVSPTTGVSFKSAPGTTSTCTASGAGATCTTDNYGFAYAEVVLGSSTGFPTITVTPPTGSPAAPFQFPVYILAQPTITSGGIIDNANYQTTITPGAIAAIKGTNLMDAGLLINTAQGYDVIPSSFTSFPLVLDGVNVSFDIPSAGISVPAPIVAVSPSQINVQVPWELQGQTSAQVKVTLDEGYGMPIYGAVATANMGPAPAFFTNNTNVADALDTKYQLITSSHPASAGQFIALYANGLGPVINTPADGQPAGTTSTTVNACTVTIGTQVLSGSQQIPFCGLAPGLAIYQINVQVPSGLPSGNQPITITIGGKTSPSGIVIPIQ